MRAGRREREGCKLLNSAVDNDAVMSGSNTADRLRVLASTGIAALAQANQQVGDIGRGRAGGGAGGGGGGVLLLGAALTTGGGRRDQCEHA